MAKGTYGWILLGTKDLDGTFERVQARDAEVVQEPIKIKIKLVQRNCFIKKYNYCIYFYKFFLSLITPTPYFPSRLFGAYAIILISSHLLLRFPLSFYFFIATSSPFLS